MYPIILVHGFIGWGRDEVLGFKYWGGALLDIQEDLRQLGFEVYTAAVGPVSSNWDRACELYAQIKGGRVDYGKIHSAEHNHERFGKTYPGFLPNLGNSPLKIHLVGHSQGGQTIRLLTELLEQGSPEEINGTQPADMNPLFQGNKSWVHSVTTISSPHNGTTLANGIRGVIPYAQQMVTLIASATTPGQRSFYDFKLDQWGLKKEPGETFLNYAGRVLHSDLWNNTKDISAWDLSPEGAKELNSWVKAQPPVYYFSWATEATFEVPITHFEVPEPLMNPLFINYAFFMGAYTNNKPGQVPIDSSWWQNDGIVNTISMNGPKIGSSDHIVPYSGIAQKGKWNYMGLMNSFDHGDIVGIGERADVQGWYRNLATQLKSLGQ